MSVFRKELLKEADFNDNGIKVKDIIKLIENTDYCSSLLGLFDIKKVQNEIIAIPGARTVVSKIISKDEQYKKFDIDTNIENVKCMGFDDHETLRLKFTIESDTDVFQITNSNNFEVSTIYEAKTSFLDGLFQIEKFADYCFSEGNEDLILDNIENLNVRYAGEKSHNRKYRIIKDINNDFYLRAITSTNKYNNYNIRFSLFIALISLHNESKVSKKTYKVVRCEYDESHIKIHFEQSGKTEVPGMGDVTFLLEVSNDEIKREAMRFLGVFKITFDKSSNTSLTIKPRNLKSRILSIRHDILPETVFNSLQLLKNIEDVKAEIVDDIKEIVNTKDANELKHLLYSKISKLQNEQIKEAKPKLDAITNAKISTIHELLLLMSKIDDLITDLDAKEYLRYIYFDILSSK